MKKLLLLAAFSTMAFSQGYKTSIATGILTTTGLPATCVTGSVRVKTTDDLIYVCGPANTWTAAGGGSSTLAIGATITGSTNNYLLIVDGTGKLSQEQRLGATRFPALTGPVTTTAGSLATAVNLAGGSISGALPAANFPALTGPVSTSAGALATAINLAGGSVSGALPAASFPALTGPVTTSAGALATAINLAGGSISGALPAANFPALTGPVTTSAGGLATAINLTGGSITNTLPAANSYFYPNIAPSTASNWTQVGISGVALVDVTGGGLSFSSATTATPGGYYIAAAGAGSNYTFRVHLEAVTSNVNTSTAGAMGVFCEDSSGNALLLHQDFITAAASTNQPRLTVSSWTGMTPANSPAFSASLLATYFPVIPVHWLGIRDNGTTRFYEYSMDGTTWVTYFSHARATFATCTRVGIEGYGDGTFASLAGVLSVRNN